MGVNEIFNNAIQNHLFVMLYYLGACYKVHSVQYVVTKNYSLIGINIWQYFMHKNIYSCFQYNLYNGEQ